MRYSKNIILKNGKECLIRNASAGDAQAVLDIFRITHEQTDFLTSYSDEITFGIDFEEKFLAEREAGEKEVYLCAIVDGRLAGTAGVDPAGGSKMAHRAVFGIAVDKAYWGMGIGKALTAACIECAREAGYSQLELEVVSDNQAAYSLYRNAGFTEFGRNPRGFCSRHNGWQELVYMRMELD